MTEVTQVVIQVTVYIGVIWLFIILMNGLREWIKISLEGKRAKLNQESKE